MHAPTAESVTTRSRHHSALLVALAVSWAAVVALFLAHDLPPLVDWPNHMARHVLESQWLVGRQLPDFYEIHHALMPNLGSDLVVPALLLAFDTLTASKIFLLLAVFVYWAGPALYALQYGRFSPSAWAVCALLLPWLMAGTFLWGFMNYYSGVGLAFLAAANHIRLARLERRPGWQLAAHALLLVLLYLWHLTSIGIYLVLAGCFMLDGFFKSGLRNWAQMLRSNAPMILTMLPALAVMIYVMLQPKLNALSGGVVWSSAFRKLTLLFSYFSAYDLATDVALMAAFGVATALTFKLTATRITSLDYAGLSALAFATLYVSLPVEVGTTSGADIRMLPPLYFTAAALLCKVPLARTSPAGLVLIAVLSLARYGTIHTTWRVMESDGKALIEYFERTKPKSRVLVVTLDRATKTNFQSHLIGWAVPAGNAYVSSIFSYAGQQPLTLHRPASEATVSGTDGQVGFDTKAIEADFDYVWLFNPNAAPFALPGTWTFVLGQGAGKLYRLPRNESP